MTATRYPIPGAQRHRVTKTITRSRFITTLAHAPGLEQAKQVIEEVRADHQDATHNCWAFVLGPPGDTARIGCSDDKEPRNTAGKPMLRTLLYSGVGEIVAVVTRYFGGIKLGTGGLIRAYTEMVRLGLESLPLMEKRDMTTLRVLTEYAFIDRLKQILPEHEAEIAAENYAADAEFVLELPVERQDGLKQALTEISGGEGLLVQTEDQTGSG